MILSIFTPTYNRSKMLSRVFQSIVDSYNIDSYNIEWIVVCDGSTDDTVTQMNNLIKNNISSIKINFIVKENGGKPSCFNAAINVARGDLFVCIDDDDFLTSNAIDEIFKTAKKYKDSKFAGIVGRVVNKKGQLLGKTIFKEVLISDTIEIRDKYKFWGEPEVYFTKLLRQYQFPKYFGETFITEAYLFDQVTMLNKLVYTNIIMMVKEYYPGGLTDHSLDIRIRNIHGTLAYYEQRVKLAKRLNSRIKSLINFYRFSFWDKGNVHLNLSVASKILKPISWLMYLRDKKKYKGE